MSEILGFRYELPDGSISAEAYDSEYHAYIRGCKQTWPVDGWHTWQVKVVNSTGDRVPTWSFCDDCNYDKHQCPGCGDSLPHESSGVCDGCLEDLKEGEKA